ncbi:MAG: RNA polymerase sigma factor [Pirellulaceae bacterium]
MTDAPETRESLLIRVRDPQDRDAWDQFVSVYRPVVYRMARLRGVQHADAEDLTQRVLVSVSQSIQDWEPRAGAKFRHWLARVAKNAAINLLSRQPKDRGRGGSGYSASIEAVSSSSEEAMFELEYRRQVYRRAADIVRHRADDKTWLAFSLTMVDGLSVEQAAVRIGESVGMIYAARSRVLRRLRNEVQRLEGDGDSPATTSKDSDEDRSMGGQA